jgi:hypothetical protein
VTRTFDRHPDLQIVLGHWGEMLLFWLDRADSLARIAGLRRSVSERDKFSSANAAALFGISPPVIDTPSGVG